MCLIDYALHIHLYHPHILAYRASVHIMRLSRWSSVSPFGQAPISISLKTTCLPLPLIDAASILGKFASQSVQKTILQNNITTKLIISPQLTTAEQRITNTDRIHSRVNFTAKNFNCAHLVMNYMTNVL